MRVRWSLISELYCILKLLIATRKWPKTTGVLRLLLQKTGQWPVHDIKSFAIGTFLSSLLLQEQIKVSDKTLCETIPSPNEIAKQMGALNTKSPVLKSSQCLCCCCYCTMLTFNIPSPPPPKKKNWHEIVAFLTIVLRQNLSLIFLRNSRKIGCFFRKFVP